MLVALATFAAKFFSLNPNDPFAISLATNILNLMGTIKFKEKRPIQYNCEYYTLYHEPSFTMSFFVLRKNHFMPLHDHPDMTVFIRLLEGKLLMTTYEFILPIPPENDTTVNHAYIQSHGAQSLLINGSLQKSFQCKKMTRIITPDSPFAGMQLLASKGPTLHSFRSLSERAIFLDIIGPPYDEEDHNCTYYNDNYELMGVTQHQLLSKKNNDNFLTTQNPSISANKQSNNLTTYTESNLYIHHLDAPDLSNSSTSSDEDLKNNQTGAKNHKLSNSLKDSAINSKIIDSVHDYLNNQYPITNSTSDKNTKDTSHKMNQSGVLSNNQTHTTATQFVDANHSITRSSELHDKIQSSSHPSHTTTSHSLDTIETKSHLVLTQSADITPKITQSVDTTQKTTQPVDINRSLDTTALSVQNNDDTIQSAVNQFKTNHYSSPNTQMDTHTFDHQSSESSDPSQDNQDFKNKNSNPLDLVNQNQELNTLNTSDSKTGISRENSLKMDSKTVNFTASSSELGTPIQPNTYNQPTNGKSNKPTSLTHLSLHKDSNTNTPKIVNVPSISFQSRPNTAIKTYKLDNGVSIPLDIEHLVWISATDLEYVAHPRVYDYYE